MLKLLFMKLQIAMPKSVNFFKKYRIYYEDTDSGGVVYYANYLKFFERCRTDFLRSSGIGQHQLASEQSIAFVVRRCNVEYVMPAKLDDEVTVTIQVKELKAASISLVQKMICNDFILSDFEVEIVCVDSNNFKPKKIPEQIRKIFLD